MGFIVKEGKNLYKNTYGYLASEQERADDFSEMILDNEVKMILFGGGNGGNELLPYINYENIKK
jgi:muramoyltetrapeptide carboxypeptidase